MNHCTLIIPRKDGRYGLAIKWDDIHTKKKTFDQTKRKWNGWGGKKEWYDPSIIFTAIREFWQESGAFCFPWDLDPVARIRFHWPGDEPGKPTMHVHIYFIDSWVGTMRERKEMGEPAFFAPEEIPYDDMMKGDRVFLPRLIEGERFVASLYFDRKDERGLPLMEVHEQEPVRPIPWYVQAYVLALIAWKKAF
jgi:hypothetical protein